MGEAVERVLREAGGPLPIPEVWRRIVRGRLYLRRDGNLPKEPHVYAFIRQSRRFRVDRESKPHRVALAGGGGGSGAVQQKSSSKSRRIPRRNDCSWATEAEVQRRVADWLRNQGWSVAEEARGRAKGPDLVLNRDGETLVVEVKGYPGKRYAHGAKRGKPKPTSPHTQMRHYFAGALVDLLRRRKGYPGARLALALPAATTYRNLTEELRWALARLGVEVLWVSEEGVAADGVSMRGDRSV